jgi:hypothetical protein
MKTPGSHFPVARFGTFLSVILAVILGGLPALFGADPQSQSGEGSAIQQTGQQYRQGNTLTGASDNRLIGRQAALDSDLAGKKALLNTKLNTFIAFFNNPLSGTQFEKFLNAPAETSDAAKTYRERISRIMDLLAPGNATKRNQDEAFSLLLKASEFESDANLCSTIHDAVYAAANTRVEVQRLTELNATLEKQRKILEFNHLQAARDRPLDQAPVDKNAAAAYNDDRKAEREARMEPTKRELASIGQTIERNKAQITGAEGQAKFQFQSLILQLFVQRRFQHVIIAGRFYRALFDDGDQSLESFQRMAAQLPYNKDAGQLKVVAKGDPKVAAAAGGGRPAERAPGAGVSAGTTGGASTNGNAGAGSGPSAAVSDQGGEGTAFSAEGMQFGVANASVESLMNAVSSGMRTLSKTFKTLSQLDGVANEIIRDVNEGVKVYRYLLEKNELEAATAQLVAIWSKGEYLPSVRLLTPEEKRPALKYAQSVNRLINASNSGNIDTLSAAVAGMKEQASDFDDTEILAGIQSAKVASSMHIAQARVAAAKADLGTVQSEIARAAGIWPNNPELQNFSSDVARMSEKASPQVQALSDFDQLYGQKNFRRIFEEKEKYIAAAAQSPDHQPRLREVLSAMQDVETALLKAGEISRHGDDAGAWEVLETASVKHPDDPKLVQVKAELTTRAPEFVHDLRQARDYEQKEEYGSALAWYLKARSRYPMSDLSREGVLRVVHVLLPDAS